MQPSLDIIDIIVFLEDNKPDDLYFNIDIPNGSNPSRRTQYFSTLLPNGNGIEWIETFLPGVKYRIIDLRTLT